MFKQFPRRFVTPRFLAARLIFHECLPDAAQARTDLPDWVTDSIQKQMEELGLRLEIQTQGFGRVAYLKLQDRLVDFFYVREEEKACSRLARILQNYEEFLRTQTEPIAQEMRTKMELIMESFEFEPFTPEWLDQKNTHTLARLEFELIRNIKTGRLYLVKDGKVKAPFNGGGKPVTLNERLSRKIRAIIASDLGTVPVKRVTYNS